MNKLVSLLSKLTSNLTSESEKATDHHTSHSEISGNWKAISYKEIVLKNEKVLNEDTFDYGEDGDFEIIFKRKYFFKQTATSYKWLDGKKLVKQDILEGTYSLTENRLVLSYNYDDPHEKKEIELDVSRDGEYLMTSNQVEVWDDGIKYLKISSRTFKRA